MPSVRSVLHRLQRISIASRLALVGGLIVACAISATVYVSIRGIEGEMRSRAQQGLDINIGILRELLRVPAGETRIESGQLRFGDYVANGNNEVVDKVKAIAGGVATIFMGDTRVATNVTTKDGARAIGTKLAQGPAYDAIFKDHRAYRGEADILGAPYFTVYEPILGRNGEVIGILFSGLRKSDFLAVLQSIIASNAISGTIISLLAATVLLVMVRRILRPLEALRATMTDLAHERLDGTIAGATREDEVGLMAQSVAVFKARIIEGRELRATQEEMLRATERERRAMLTQLAEEFDRSVGASLETVSGAARQMRSTAQGMSATAEETNNQATTVAAAAEQASANVRTVASSAEELTSSVGEIGRQVAESAKIAKQAVGEATHTDATVQGLSEAAAKIGDVVALITNIATQTNLLALNATIEAARAGEAGKGFAVVANEVKSLANQTANATGEIAGQIAAMRDATSEAVQAIESICGTIGNLDAITTAIASAVEQQGAATREIARNVQEAAAGTQQVSSNIVGVNDAAGETGKAATAVRDAADTLGAQAERLRADIDKFLAKIRA